MPGDLSEHQALDALQALAALQVELSSECVRDTVEMGGDSRDSTGFVAMEERLPPEA